MHLKKLQLQNFRNYQSLEIEFPKEGALFEGDNGAGKTNVLESIHVLCTSRSQRGASRADMIANGCDAAYVEGTFSYSQSFNVRDDVSDGNNSNDTSNTNDINDINDTNIINETNDVTAAIGFSRDKKVVMKHDGVSVQNYSEWFGKRPVVSFGTNDLNLVYGAPEVRRQFVDMLICQMDREYLRALLSYRKNMACRNALLGKTNDNLQFEVYESAMADAAAVLVFKRDEIIENLRESARLFYGEICNESEKINVEYAPKIKEKINKISDVSTWRNLYLNILCENRFKDTELSYTSVGPHRDDLRFFLNDKAAKSYASQGQCRTIALALKLAAVEALEKTARDGMIFLVDDAVSELDHERTCRAYPLLVGRGQIFIATPRCLADVGDGVMKCTVEQGRVKIA